ncbi:MAG: hypothetical protein Q8M57_12730 [Nitrosomonas sp.]|uniref:hypothetical protein n=1 Tax=Nitrosomonas sp. TaxID=42353 RepID=UPI002732D9C1|nr:hypothetical protein [Nitrosomonas sp.]MDP3281890.1 hypothetical protein [Nitrosomonas sp.]
MNSKSHSCTTDEPDNFPAWCPLRTFCVLLVVFLVALLFHSDLAPLEETHWDAVIYVDISKRAAETQLLADYHQHAHEIPLEPVGLLWHFTRIGHVLLLGEVARLFGTTETALVAMQWLYRVFMALGVTLCIVLSSRLVVLFRPNKPDSIWWAGYFLGAVFYIASDSYRGLQGHLLSEPPAFVILALFAVMLVRAVERRSLAVGAFAGCLLFLVFFIRIDATLPGIIFATVLLAALIMSRKFDAVPSIISAGLVSLFLYLVYAWWFFPLVNLQTLANFSTAAKELFPGPPAMSLYSIAVAGGLLWVGACAAVPMWRDPLVRFAMVWLGLALLPMMIDSLNWRAVQARMGFDIVLPLLVLCGEGWSLILRNFIKQRKIRPLLIALGSVMVLAFAPYSLIQQETRNLVINHLPSEIHKYLFPSLLKNAAIAPVSPYQDSRLGLLVRPLSERRTFEYSKMRALGDYLYVPERPAYLLWPGTKVLHLVQLEDYVGLIRFFGKKYPENADIFLTKLPNKDKTIPCTARAPTMLEPLVFCSTLVYSDLQVLRKNNIPLYILGVDGYPLPDMPQLKLEVLLSEPPFVLYGITE